MSPESRLANNAEYFWGDSTGSQGEKLSESFYLLSKVNRSLAYNENGSSLQDRNSYQSNFVQNIVSSVIHPDDLQTHTITTLTVRVTTRKTSQ